jgi:hypothetical protein
MPSPGVQLVNEEDEVQLVVVGSCGQRTKKVANVRVSASNQRPKTPNPIESTTESEMPKCYRPRRQVIASNTMVEVKVKYTTNTHQSYIVKEGCSSTTMMMMMRMRMRMVRCRTWQRKQKFSNNTATNPRLSCNIHKPGNNSSTTRV